MAGKTHIKDYVHKKTTERNWNIYLSNTLAGCINDRTTWTMWSRAAITSRGGLNIFVAWTWRWWKVVVIMYSQVNLVHHNEIPFHWLWQGYHQDMSTFEVGTGLIICNLTFPEWDFSQSLTFSKDEVPLCTVFQQCRWSKICDANFLLNFAISHNLNPNFFTWLPSRFISCKNSCSCNPFKFLIQFHDRSTTYSIIAFVSNYSSIK
jgi:hypothetical protein